MNDIIEVEDIVLTNENKNDLETINDLLSFFLRSNPEEWDLSFVQDAYKLLITNNTPVCLFIDKIFNDEEYRNRYIALKRSVRY